MTQLPGQHPQQGIGLDQVAAMRQMAAANKGQAIMNIALQMFLQGKAASISDSFTLAEGFIAEFERRYSNTGP